MKQSMKGLLNALNTLELGNYSGQTFTASGTFTVPYGVTRIAIVAIGRGGNGGSNGFYGGGGGGGGGALAYSNSIKVYPGEKLSVIIDTTSSRVKRFGTAALLVAADAGGNGARGTDDIARPNVSGGSAGAAANSVGDITFSGAGGTTGFGSGAGGAGGGAAGYSANGNTSSGGSGRTGASEQGGGGVSFRGEGPSGTTGGQAGSYGSNGIVRSGGSYGGGGGGAPGDPLVINGGSGGGGVVRIIWGPTRAFPSTDINYMEIVGTTTSNDGNISLPSGYKSGDVAYIVAIGPQTATYTTPSGWTLAAQSDIVNLPLYLRYRVFSKTLTSSDSSSYTISSNLSGAVLCWCARYIQSSTLSVGTAGTDSAGPTSLTLTYKDASPTVLNNLYRIGIGANIDIPSTPATSHTRITSHSNSGYSLWFEYAVGPLTSTGSWSTTSNSTFSIWDDFVWLPVKT